MWCFGGFWVKKKKKKNCCLDIETSIKKKKTIYIYNKKNGNTELVPQISRDDQKGMS